MPNTYTQIHIQFVFAVKFRMALINASWKEDLHQYITGIIQNKTHKMLQVNTMPDHLHMLVGLRPNENMSKLIQVVKSESTKFINDQHFTQRPFAWQEGFGAFSYSRSQLDSVAKYVLEQEKHHSKHSFKDEYVALLDRFEVEYEERYLFKWTE